MEVDVFMRLRKEQVTKCIMIVSQQSVTTVRQSEPCRQSPGCHKLRGLVTKTVTEGTSQLGKGVHQVPHTETAGSGDMRLQSSTEEIETGGPLRLINHPVQGHLSKKGG